MRPETNSGKVDNGKVYSILFWKSQISKLICRLFHVNNRIHGSCLNIFHQFFAYWKLKAECGGFLFFSSRLLYLFPDILNFWVCYGNTDWCSSKFKVWQGVPKFRCFNIISLLCLIWVDSDFYHKYSKRYLGLIKILSQWFSFHLDTHLNTFLQKSCLGITLSY